MQFLVANLRYLHSYLLKTFFFQIKILQATPQLDELKTAKKKKVVFLPSLHATGTSLLFQSLIDQKLDIPSSRWYNWKYFIMLPGGQSQSEIPFHDQTNVLDDNDRSQILFFQ